MTRSLFVELSWLPAPADDFASCCAALQDGSDAVGGELQALASFSLNEHQLKRLASTIEMLRSRPERLHPLIPFRLGVASNATVELALPALVATAARHGFALDCVAGAHDQSAQEALRADSVINSARPDAVLLALDHRAFALDSCAGDRDAAALAVAAALAHVDTLCEGFRRTGATCLLQTLAAGVDARFGSLDAVLEGSGRRSIDAFNLGLAERANRGNGITIVDVAGAAERVGLADWHDPTLWNIAKVPFSTQFLPLYAEFVCRVISALRGKSRRCLVLDLDNTLWSGVIGDDGVDGIIVGNGDPTGEAFLEVQRTALALRERGIVLAVCSKNDDAIAREPFRTHPDMLLREDHFAVFQANWHDKPSNIRAIAERLSLGLDAMVLLDDNPAERELVRRVLPEVAVPELPDDPALYGRALVAAGYFEAVVFSAEDRTRAEKYRQNAERVELKQSIDLDDYLRSLDMTISFQPFDAAGGARTAQLIAKSNQFNLTTVRYNDAQIAAFANDPDRFTLQVRLADRFGDNGMISVVICVRHGVNWEIDTWLMSCRVLGRKVEHAVLNELVRNARLRNIVGLQGTYVPTGRNRLVEDHYRGLGFDFAGHTPDGVTRWSLATSSYTAPAAPMRVISAYGND